MNNNFKAGQIIADSELIFKELIEILKNNNFNEYALKLKEGISASKQSEKIKVAFVGQFSSGKSSIISALTENKAIKIGSDVTTDKSENYDWGSFLLTDTPGLQNNETHDKIAENAIEKSDLIIYCITSELFSKNTLADFKKLAFEKSYKNKMILLINKINSEFTTDTDALLKTYETQLEKDLQPYNLDDIPLCFIDTKDYLDGLKYGEKELINDSRFNDFIRFLNEFLVRNGLMCKLATPILLAKQITEEAFIDVSESQEEKEKRIALSRLGRLVDKHRTEASRNWEYLISEEIYSFIHQGFELVNSLGEEAIDSEIRIKEIIENTNKKIADQLQAFVFECDSKLRDDLDEALQGKIGQYLLTEADTKDLNISEPNGKKNNGDELNHVVDSTGRFATKLTAKIKPEQMYNIVEKIGHKVLKIKFKPWGITNAAGKLLQTLKALGPVLDVVTFAIDIKSTYDESKEAKELALAKKELRKEIKEIADEIHKGFDEQKDSFLSEIYEPVLSEIDRMDKAITEHTKRSSDFNNELSTVKDKLNALLDTIV